MAGGCCNLAHVLVFIFAHVLVFEVILLALENTINP